MACEACRAYPPGVPCARCTLPPEAAAVLCRPVVPVEFISIPPGPDPERGCAQGARGPLSKWQLEDLNPGSVVSIDGRSGWMLDRCSGPSIMGQQDVELTYRGPIPPGPAATTVGYGAPLHLVLRKLEGRVIRLLACPHRSAYECVHCDTQRCMVSVCDALLERRAREIKTIAKTCHDCQAKGLE